MTEPRSLEYAQWKGFDHVIMNMIFKLLVNSMSNPTLLFGFLYKPLPPPPVHVIKDVI